MRKALSVLVGLFLLFSGQPHADLLDPGKWRWDVKTLQDDEAAQIASWRFSSPQKLTIAASTQLAPIKPLSKKTKRGAGPEEFRVYRVTGTAMKAKLEPDGDYHFIIKDEQGNRLNVELVLPDFAPQTTQPNRIDTARRKFEQAFGFTTDNTSWGSYRVLPPKRVTIKGVGFFDQLHGQSGGNRGFEIHPVTGFQLLE